MGPVCKHHLAVANAGKPFSGCLDIVGLAGRDHDLHR